MSTLLAVTCGARAAARRRARAARARQQAAARSGRARLLLHDLLQRRQREHLRLCERQVRPVALLRAPQRSGVAPCTRAARGVATPARACSAVCAPSLPLPIAFALNSAKVPDGSVWYSTAPPSAPASQPAMSRATPNGRLCGARAGVSAGAGAASEAGSLRADRAPCRRPPPRRRRSRQSVAPGRTAPGCSSPPTSARCS